MDIQLLKTFSVVARLENITQAAELLNFTQPTVSAQIRTLEEHFGVQLFERIGKKLYITEAGKYLVEPAEKMLAIYSETVNQLGSITEGSNTRIGLSTNYINYILSPALLKLQAIHAAGTIRVEICANSKAVLHGLNNNQYDIGLVHDHIAEKYLDTVAIRSDDLVWCGHKSILAKRGCLKITDYPIVNFRQGCTFRRLCDALLQKNGLTSTFEYSDFDAVKSAMSEGLGIALLPRVVAKIEKEIIILDECTDTKITLYAITRQDKCLSPSVKSLLKLLQEH
ncbi:LysR family transcriptional regulator [Sporomusaceae bacterium FL31]|nr:LysR family transcriptional regulator [Sporomusaceae bacterium FL31]GCE34504.1 LysR family transcriptional regulator [Sporomusaceae bacterium]